MALCHNPGLIILDKPTAGLDMYALAHIDKEAMTDIIRSELIGIKETTFGYEGLCTKALKFQNVAGVKLSGLQLRTYSLINIYSFLVNN